MDNKEFILAITQIGIKRTPRVSRLSYWRFWFRIASENIFKGEEEIGFLQKTTNQYPQG